jgi:hypothetical protein
LISYKKPEENLKIHLAIISSIKKGGDETNIEVGISIGDDK